MKKSHREVRAEREKYCIIKLENKSACFGRATRNFDDLLLKNGCTFYFVIFFLIMKTLFFYLGYLCPCQQYMQ